MNLTDQFGPLSLNNRFNGRSLEKDREEFQIFITGIIYGKEIDFIDNLLIFRQEYGKLHYKSNKEVMSAINSTKRYQLENKFNGKFLSYEVESVKEIFKETAILEVVIHPEWTQKEEQRLQEVALYEKHSKDAIDWFTSLSEKEQFLIYFSPIFGFSEKDIPENIKKDSENFYTKLSKEQIQYYYSSIHLSKKVMFTRLISMYEKL